MQILRIFTGTRNRSITRALGVSRRENGLMNADWALVTSVWTALLGILAFLCLSALLICVCDFSLKLIFLPFSKADFSENVHFVVFSN